MWHTTHTNDDGTFSPALMIPSPDGMAPVLWVDNHFKMKREVEAEEIALRNLNNIRHLVKRALVEGHYKEVKR